MLASTLEALALAGIDMNGDSRAGGHAYAVLRAGIVRNLIPAGTRLTEAELAEALGVSRTPVRYALQELLREGLVELGSRRQVFVREFTFADRREVVLLREALEGVAIVEACRSIALAEVDELQLLLIRQRRAADQGDVEAFIDLDDKFHLGIARGARLPLLRQFLSQLRASIRLMGLRVAMQDERLLAVLDEHMAILVALEAHDADAALAALSLHLANTYALFPELSSPEMARPSSVGTMQ